MFSKHALSKFTGIELLTAVAFGQLSQKDAHAILATRQAPQSHAHPHRKPTRAAA